MVTAAVLRVQATSSAITASGSSMSAVHMKRTAHLVYLGGVSADQRRCVVRGGVEPPTFRFSEGLCPDGSDHQFRSYQPVDLRKWPIRADETSLADVPPRAG
jgi:hypothetical protein